jgi:mRNA-degrading endonuclease RelE of RelBE toxin-antitoxin system
LKRFRVLLSETARKQLQDLPDDAQDRIKGALKHLEDDPFRSRPGVDIKRLRGPGRDYHRLRTGDHRSIYVVDDDRVLVAKILRRSKAYKWLD